MGSSETGTLSEGFLRLIHKKMKWFKFYGQDYLSDPKMLSLNACERSCWVTLLAYGSVNDNGVITFLSEEQVMLQAGISPMNDEWEIAQGVLKKLEKLGMITLDNEEIRICNWEKRQDLSLTSYERVKRYREKKKNETGDNGDDNAMITLEENRIDKNRKEEKKNIKEKPSASYLISIPQEDIDEFVKRFDIYPKQVISLGESLKLYCESKGKRYSNYKSFLLNAIKRDFKERVVEAPKKEIPEITEEQRKENIERLKEMKAKLFKK